MKAGALVVVTAAVAVVGGCVGRPVSLLPPGPSCTVLDSAYAATIDATRWRPLPDGFLAVPVVVHLMTDPADPPDKQPEQYWTAERVATYLGMGNLSVNAVWAKARIRFDVRRIQRCLYAPPPGTFRVLASGAKSMFTPDVLSLRKQLPAEQQVVIDHYLRLNVTYGVPRMLNVYLWRNIGGGVNGYGESPRRNRVEVAERHLQAVSTVWYESWADCFPIEGGDDCQLSVAHELGHALGLGHSCYLDTCSTTLCWLPRDYYFTCRADQPANLQWDNWTACEGRPGDGVSQGYTAAGEPFAACPPPAQAIGRRLMYPNANGGPGSGGELLEGEIESARSGAREFF